MIIEQYHHFFSSCDTENSNPTPANVYGWDCATIRNILENQQYIGCTVIGVSHNPAEQTILITAKESSRINSNSRKFR